MSGWLDKVPRGRADLFLLGGLLSVLALWLKTAYRLPLGDTLLWYSGVFMTCYVPGSLLLRWVVPTGQDSSSRLLHALGLGFALHPPVYAFLRAVGAPWAMAALLGGLLIIWFTLLFRDRRRYPHSYRDIAALLFLMAFALVILHLSHFTDVVFRGSGFDIRTLYTETVFHLGFVNVLTHAYPPFFPYASGVPFSQYHLFMHLHIELFHRFLGLDTLSVTFFFFPLLSFSLLVGLPYLLTRHLGCSRSMGVLAGVLMLGSDFSFLPGMLGAMPPQAPWTIAFTTTVWSLLTLNGYLPALPVLFLFLIHLVNFSRTGSRKSVIMFVLLGYASFGFKSSMGLHIFGTLLLTGLVSAVLPGERKVGRRLVAASALLALAMAADLVLLRGGAGRELALEPFTRLDFTLMMLGLRNMPGWFPPAGFVILLLAAFGIRMVGFVLLRDMLRQRSFDPVVLFIMLFALAGFVLPDIVLIRSPGSGVENDAAWFASQGLMAAWLIVPLVLGRVVRKRARLVLAVLVLVLAAPSTLQFLSLRYNDARLRVGSDDLDVVRYLKETPGDSVVLHPPEPAISLASTMAGRQSIRHSDHTFLSVYAGVSEDRERERFVRAFFSPEGRNVRGAVLRKYGVTHVYAPLALARTLDAEPALNRTMMNGTYAVYKVSAAPK
jgi:hypothetical protein